MSLLGAFRILTVLLLLGGWWHKSPITGIEGRDAGNILKKREIGRSSSNIEDFSRESFKAAEQSADGLNNTPSKPDTGSRSNRGTNVNHDPMQATLTTEQNQLSSTRKEVIQEELASHHEQVKGMRTEWQKLVELFEFLEEHIDWLKSYGKVASNKTIEGILEELRNYQNYISKLVQDRLRSLGGLGGIVIGPKYRGTDGNEIKQATGSECTKPVSLEKNVEATKDLNANRITRSLQSSLIMGHSSLLTVLRENVETQTKASIKVSESQHAPLKQDMREIRSNLVGVISDKMKDASVLELNMILHSITFPPVASGPDYGHYADRKVIKTCFETLVFQGLQYMYQFNLITNDHLSSFFAKGNTQEITGIHLTDLFDVYDHGFSSYDAFMPDMNFIRSHWYTEHLHISLPALEEKQQACVLYTALKETGRVMFLMEDWSQVRTQKYHMFFFEENMFTKLNFLKEKKLGNGENLIEIDETLRNNFETMITFFQTPPSIKPLRGQERLFPMERYNYLLTYHILNFMKTYNPEILNEFFPTTEEYYTLETQLDLLKVGLEILHHLNKSIELPRSFPFPFMNFHKTQVQEVQRGISQGEMKRLSEKYEHLSLKVLKLADENPHVKNWMEGDTFSDYILSFIKRKIESSSQSGHPDKKFDYLYRNIWMFEWDVYAEERREIEEAEYLATLSEGTTN